MSSSATAPDDARNSPSFRDDADEPPQADGEEGADDPAEVQVEENLADLGGAADDGDDSDPCKFIEKSLHYQDMMMTKRHCEERVAFFEEFRKTMPKGKDPHKRMKLYEDRVEKVQVRIKTFRSKYAKNRMAGTKSRADRIAKDKDERAKTEVLGKGLQSAIRKDVNSKQDLATRAAIAAIEELGDEASAEDKEKAAAEAFAASFAASLAANPFKLPAKEVKVAKPACKKAKYAAAPVETAA